MDIFDEEFDGIVFPVGNKRNITHPLEEKIIAELMFLTHVYRLNSRKAMTEFLKRIFLKFNSPLNLYIDNYFKSGTILELETQKGTFNLTLSCLAEWIGITRKLSSNFAYIGTTEDFINDQSKYQPSSFYVSLRNDFCILPAKTMNDANTIALFFTDMFDEIYFKKSSSVINNQYVREPLDFVCFEKTRAVMFDPLKQLSASTLCKIEQKIGRTKLQLTDEFIETSEDEKFAEIIRIAFGIKNGYINPRGHLCNYSKSVDPYFFFSLTPLIDVYLNSRTFMDLYHYWSMCDWIELLPEE